MIEREVTIVNSLGMHARPAAQIVRLAATFAASLELECDGQRVNGKSIMGVMMLAAEQGARVTIRSEGADAAAAVDALATLINCGFGES